VYLKKSPKWSPYGVALSMALMGRHFEEVYKKPQRCGHESLGMNLKVFEEKR
jgi:hypothetical protein